MDYIKDKALLLIKRYENKFNESITDGIPVEEIAEFLLELDLEYDDPSNLNLSSETLGAIYPEGKMFINSNLTNKNSSEGRYRFTVAHEIGHWILHKEFLRGTSVNNEKLSLFNDGALSESPNGIKILCRKDDASNAEWQADTFAAFLLMPPHLIRPYFEELLDYYTEKGIYHIEENICSDISKRFNTSLQATKIHLDTLNLSCNQLRLF